jgi:hypothetical protein
MIHREYLVVMPTKSATMPFLDIPVIDPAMGLATRELPLGSLGGPPLPTGWQTGLPFIFAPGGMGDGQVCELRSRILRIEALASAGAAGGFVPRLRLGGYLGMAMLGTTLSAVPPPAQFSQSLAGATAGPYAASVIPDPVYGILAQPVIRLWNTTNCEGLIVLVSLGLATSEDEDGATGRGV